MNFLKALTPSLKSHLNKFSLLGTITLPTRHITNTRCITSLCCNMTTTPTVGYMHVSKVGLLSPTLQNSRVDNIQPARTYMVKGKLKRRCAGCYFERRNGRLFVECTLKPRHKQMQQQKGKEIFRDDYSSGPWKRNFYWGWKKNMQWYKAGDNHYARHNWLSDRLGKDV